MPTPLGSAWTDVWQDVWQDVWAGAATDTTAPTISVTNPAHGGIVSGTVTITYSASDDTAVTSVQAKIDGVTLTPVDSSGPPWTFTWNTTLETEGYHTISGLALDAASNEGVAAAIIVTVDNVPDPPPPPPVGAGLVPLLRRRRRL